MRVPPCCGWEVFLAYGVAHLPVSGAADRLSAKILRCLRPLAVEPGQFLFSAGYMCTDLYWVRRGKVELIGKTKKEADDGL